MGLTIYIIRWVWQDWPFVSVTPEGCLTPFTSQYFRSVKCFDSVKSNFRCERILNDVTSLNWRAPIPCSSAAVSLRSGSWSGRWWFDQRGLPAKPNPESTQTSKKLMDAIGFLDNPFFFFRQRKNPREMNSTWNMCREVSTYQQGSSIVLRCSSIKKKEHTKKKQKNKNKNKKNKANHRGKLKCDLLQPGPTQFKINWTRISNNTTDFEQALNSLISWQKLVDNRVEITLSPLLSED